MVSSYRYGGLLYEVLSGPSMLLQPLAGEKIVIVGVYGPDMERSENCLRNICGLRRTDRVPNVEIRRCGKNVSVSQRIDQGVLRWFGHVKRMGDERMAKRVCESNVRGVRRRERPRKCWMDGVKEVLARKGLNIQKAKVSMQDRNEWRSICRGVKCLC